ncbi:MAG: hypothetical protein DSZ28_07610 [Thiothrix sp.]|nr:MAG: hypothetical protein DSZ28_07610 [Thiothrix sp.]
MLSTSKLDLILPGIFGRLSDWSAGAVSQPSFPIIERLLSLSNRRKIVVTGYESTLWSLFDPQHSATEELTAGMQLSGGEGDEQVCCADPVHLRLDISRLMLIDQSQFSISDTERTAFSALINEYLAERGGRFFFDSNGRGFLAVKKPRSVSTTPLSEVTGNDISSMMPKGEQKTFWHQIMNELQMLLYSAPFNEARAERGEPAINALWIWGTGQLDRSMEPQYSDVYGSEPFAEALAQSVGIPTHPSPQKFNLSLMPDSSHHLLVLSDLLPHSQYDDYPGWHTIMERLCADWFSPLLDAVRRKQLSRVTLYPCNGTCYVLEPGYQWRFWRWTKPLLSHLS